jgi:hypothetical protein
MNWIPGDMNLVRSVARPNSEEEIYENDNRML